MRGFCFRCGKQVGGAFKAQAWACPVCRHIYCEKCARERVGILFKKPVCPECRIELRSS